MAQFPTFSLALFMTLLRLLVAPIVIPILIYLYVGTGLVFLPIVALVFFSLTDYLDGFFARRYNQVTQLGSMLDHVADKVFMMAVLVSLVAVQVIPFGWVILLLAREFYMMGLRQVAVQFGGNAVGSVAVSRIGKIKTALQMIVVLLWLVLPLYGLWWQLLNALTACVVTVSYLGALSYTKRFLRL